MKYIKEYFRALGLISMVMGIVYLWGTAIGGSDATAVYFVYTSIVAAIAGPIALRIK